MEFRTSEAQRRATRKYRQRIPHSKTARYTRDMEEGVIAIRSALRRALSRSGYASNARTKSKILISLLGFSGQQLRNHMAQFLGCPCMDCGVTEITLATGQIDHIKPLGRNITNERMVQLSQLSNLRLICGPCNLIKGDKASDIVIKVNPLHPIEISVRETIEYTNFRLRPRKRV